MIALHDVSKWYQIGKEKVHALLNVSAELSSKEINVVMGPSGSGKSTLLQIIGGLDEPTSGEVMVNGKNLALMAEGERAVFRNEHVGFVFQDALLLPHLTVLQNVLSPTAFAKQSVHRKAYEERAHHLINIVGLSRRAHHYPEELSGGQRQRVVIARALMMQPGILLADEPTGNLDQKTAGEIIDLFKKLHQEYKMLLVIATHDEQIAGQAKVCLKIVDGVVV